VFVPGRPFEPNLMLVGKAGSLLKRVVRKSYFTDVGSSLTCQGWKGFPRANTPAYYTNSFITAVKSFTTLAPGRDDVTTRPPPLGGLTAKELK
jgi:hypothetical protein